MYVEFTILNKVCPKDHYSLPSMDRLVDSTSRYEVVSFIDAILGYYLILIEAEDAEKTIFIIEEGVFFYKVMYLWLKNVGASYQRLVIGNFKDLIKISIEDYAYDIVVKSHTLEDNLGDIQRVLDILDKTCMELNLEKCTFRVKARKYLGYIILEKVIEANAKKIKVI